MAPQPGFHTAGPSGRRGCRSNTQERSEVHLDPSMADVYRRPWLGVELRRTRG